MSALSLSRVLHHTSRCSSSSSCSRLTFSWSWVVLFCVLSSLCSSFPSVDAWWDAGHMATALVAIKYLKSPQYLSEGGGKVLANVNFTLALFPPALVGPRVSDLVQTAPWPDDLKNVGLGGLDDWHFVNWIYNPTNISIDSSCLIAKRDKQGVEIPAINGYNTGNSNNVVWASAQLAQALDFCDNKDDNAPTCHGAPFAAGFALRYLSHLIGDMHQPLHCIVRYDKQTPHGDAGGNFIDVYVNGTKMKLHAYWDSCAQLLPDGTLTRPLSDESWAILEQFVEEAMRRAGPDSENPPKRPDETMSLVEVLQSFALESYEMASTMVYWNGEKTRQLADGDELDEAYQKAAKDAVYERIAHGGYRLAYLLRHFKTLPRPWGMDTTTTTTTTTTTKAATAATTTTTTAATAAGAAPPSSAHSIHVVVAFAGGVVCGAVGLLGVALISKRGMPRFWRRGGGEGGIPLDDYEPLVSADFAE
mmetsp:Transcript_5750/g.14723  ORF Transcript_5750/g.14723 Transcript_5750/m.14723 type:complete len:475 (+) Transcript_5750:83-1507(+)